jgi:hypothetical protein
MAYYIKKARMSQLLNIAGVCRGREMTKREARYGRPTTSWFNADEGADNSIC